MKTFLPKSALIAITFLLANLFFVSSAFGQTTGDYRTTSDADWSALTTWQRWDGGAWVTPTVAEGYPGEFSVPTLVTVLNGHDISLDVSPANNIGSIYIDPGTLNSSIAFTGTNSLTVSGSVTIDRSFVNFISKTINVGGGTLSCGSVAMNNSGNANRVSTLTVDTGTISVTGNIAMAGPNPRNIVSITSTGTINAGGNITGGGFLTVPGSTVNYNGADQIVRAVAYAGNLTLSGSGTKTMTGVSVVDGNFTLSGTASATAAAALTIGGVVTLGSGTTFTGGAFTHNLSGNWVNNGAVFINTGNTINFSGNPQSIGGSVSTSFNNVILSNAGVKTFSIATFINGNLSINGPATADLSSITTHTTSTLTLDAVNQVAGTHGSTASAATNQNDTYFELTSGFITVTSQIPTTYYSRATGDWNVTSTWSTVGFGSPVNAGTFPVAGDIVNIGGGFAVTVTANAACSSLIFAAASSDNTVNINSGFILAVSGAVSIPAASAGFSNLINVGPGTLNAGSIALAPGSGTDPRHRIEISTGTVTVTGNLTGSAGDTSGSIIFSDAGLLQLGGAGANSIYTPANGTLTTVAGSTVEYNGANQTIRAHSYLGTLLLSGSGTKTFTNSVAGASIPGNLTFSGTASATALRALTIGGDLTLETGSTFTAASFTHNVAGNWINNGGAFTNTGGTINLNGTAVQSIGGTTSTNFNNLTLSSTGNKTFDIETYIDGTLSIPGPAIADLGAGFNHTASTLILGGIIQAPNIFGSTSSGAVIQNDTYFANTGTVTVAGETFYARQSGNWNDNNTWSFTPGGPAVGAGIFPDVDDVVFMQGVNITVTVTADAACGSVKYTSASNNRTLTINPGFTLSVSGVISIPRANAGFLNLINVDGTLNAGSIAFTSSGNGAVRHQITISSTGTANVSGDITTNNNTSGATITLAGTLNAGVGILTTGTPAGGTLTTVLNSTVNYNGSADQRVKPVTYNGNLILSGSGAKNMTGVNTVDGDFTISGSATTAPTALTVGGDLILTGTASLAPTAALTVTGSVTLGSGTTFTTGAFTHNVAGDWINNGGNFANTGSTINLNGTAVQSIGGSNPTTFNNLTLSNTGNKTFTLLTAIDGNLSIPGPAIADLGVALSHTAGALILGGINQAPGIYGSTISSAPVANQNDTYFANTGTVAVTSAGFYSIASGNWDANTTWSYTQGGAPVGAGIFPAAGANVNIVDGFNVTVNVPSTCATLTFGPDAVSNTVTISSSLNVTGAITIPRATVNGQTNLLAVGTGTLSAGSIRFTNGGAGAGIRHRMTISTGIVTVTGDITTDNANAGANINLTGTGTINAGVGIFTTLPAGGTFTTAANSTVNYNGAAQTIKSVNYLGNLTLSGSGLKTLLAGTTSIGGNLTLSGSGTNAATVVGLTISGNLILGDGTSFTAAGFPITVGGSTTVGDGLTGQLSISSATGIKRFNGLVTIANGGTWDNTGNSPVFFGGGITNNGTFNAGTGLHTFDNASQALSGTTGNFIIPNVAVTGVTLTNTNSLTVATSLSGTGGLTQGSNAILNLGGTTGITTLDASAVGNTVNYNGTTNQAVIVPLAGQYANLSFNGTTAAGIAAPPLLSTLSVSENWQNNGVGTFGSFTGFNPNDGTIIFNGTSTVSGASITSFHDVQLISGSTLTFPAGDVRVSGDIEFEAGSTFNPSNGRVVINGAAPQTIDVNDTEFYSIQVNKTGGTVDILSSLPIQHLLDIPSATTVNTNDNLVLLSRGFTTELDAAIGPLSGATVNGDVTVQRYMDPIGLTFRYLASPVTGALPPAEWGTDIKTYVYSGGVGSYVTHPTTNPLLPETGYVAQINMVSPITWSVSGPINTGPATWNFGEAGWHLIGNPFPSAIRWFNSGALTLTNVSVVIGVTDNSILGYPNYFRYWSYNPTVPGDPGTSGTALAMENGVIAMGQAFWVYVGAGGGSLTIQEQAKESAVNGEFYRTQATDDSNSLTITLDNGKFADVAYLKLNPNAREEYEFRYDLKKLWNPEMNVYLVDADRNELVINTLDKIAEDKKLPLGLEVAAAGQYTLSFSNYEQFTYGNTMFLIDVVEGKAIPVSGGKYTFDVRETSLSVKNRFFLSLSSNAEWNLADRIETFPNPVQDKLTVLIPRGEKVSLQVMDNQGKEFLSEQLEGSSEINMTNYPKGMYVFRFFTKKEIVIRKIMR